MVARAQSDATLPILRHYGRRVAKLVLRRHTYLALLCLIAFFASAAVMLVWAVDPYLVYGSTRAPRLTHGQIDPSAQPRLLNVITRQGYDTIIVGGSTAQQFLAADAEATLKGTSRAFTLAYSAPRPRDLKIVMDKVAAADGLKRVLLSFDSSYLFPGTAGRAEFPFALYSGDVFDRVRMTNAESVSLAFRMLSGGDYFLPEWDFANVVRQWARERARSLTPGYIARARAEIDERRARVLDPAHLTCKDVGGIGIISSFARVLAARGIPLDVVVPPYSYLLYYEWFDQNRQEMVRGEPPLAVLLTMRRCLLEETAGIENVTVYAFDLHSEIVGDMANYRDVAHLNGSAVGRQILSLIDAGDGRLTLANFDAYAAELRRNVAAFNYTNSALAKP